MVGLLALLGIGCLSQAGLDGQVNVALSSWGYAHATASTDFGPLYDANRALDGSWKSRDGNKWNSARSTGPQWLRVDLGRPFLIDAIVVRHEGVFAEGNLYNTSNFQIQRAEKPTGPWVDLVPPIVGNRYDVTTHRFAPVRTRFLRLYVTKGEPNANAYARIFEFEVYAPKDSIDAPMIKLGWPDVPQFRKRGGKLESAATVERLSGTGIGLSFKVNGLTEAPTSDGTLWIPAGGPQTVTLDHPNGPKWRMSETRSWLAGLDGGEIHLVSSSHQDVAWIDTPDWCRENRVKLILEPAIDLLERDPRYRFTMENMLNLFELLELRPQRRAEIEKLVREGRLEFGGTYNQPYESLLGGEQLIRQTYFGRRWLRKEFPGCDTHFAYTVDVPGRSLQMQQILAKAGIRDLVTSRYHEGLYRWYSPDGSSILVVSHAHYGNYSGTLKEPPQDAARDLPAAVKGFADDFSKRGIPPHFMVINSQDFERPVNFGSLLDAWSKQPPIAVLDGKPINAPKLDYSSTGALFASVDKPSAKPRALMGERPNMWLYIHGPTHHEAIQAQREAARLLPVAETFATMRSLLEGSFVGYPQARLSTGWLDSLYPDHGFGGKNGHITDAVFHAKFRSGREAAQQVLHDSLQAIAEHVKTDRSKGVPVVVFNPHSWTRRDTVTVAAPTAGASWSVVDSGGKPVASQCSSAPKLVNVASPGEGARVIASTGSGAEHLLAPDWWDPRRGHWESPAPAEVTIDLGQARPVQRVLIRHYGAYGEFGNEERWNTRGCRLFGAGSASGPWSDGTPVDGNRDPVSVLEFAPRSVRYLRLQITDPTQGVDHLARIIGLEAFALKAPARTAITFNAAAVPSLGYRTFYLRRSKAPRVDSNVVENEFYRIKLAPGGIASLYDKQAKAELFRHSRLIPGEVFTLKSVGNGAGEFGAVQQPTMEGFDRVGAHKPAWRRNAAESGVVRSVYELRQNLGGATVRQTLVVYNHIKRIDFDVDLGGWNGAKYREFRIAFPLGGPKARVSYEVPMGTVRIGRDEIPTTGGWAYGSLDYWQKCSDIHPREVQDFIRVEDGRIATTISTSVSVFDFIDPTGMAGQGPTIQPILLASRKSCHWEGNWYTQPGDHHFHFSLTSSPRRAHSWEDAAAAQLPLMAVLPIGSGGALPESLSFAGTDMPNVRISTVKKAEDDGNVIVRCYEVDGRPAKGTVRLFLPVRSASACNIIEDETRPLWVSSGGVPVSLGKFSIETFKLWPADRRYRAPLRHD